MDPFFSSDPPTAPINVSSLFSVKEGESPNVNLIDRSCDGTLSWNILEVFNAGLPEGSFVGS